MTSLVRCGVALLYVCAVTSFAAEPEEDLSEEGEGALPVVEEHVGSLYAEAQRQLAAMRQSTYTHQVSIDEATGRFDYDCSGFVSYALSRVNRAALAQVRNEPGKRPLAKHYEAFLAKLPPIGAGQWMPVKTADALERGDVVAWKKPANSLSKNTGHVVIVAGAPRKRGQGEYVVPIIDSTALPHGHGDARYQRATGLGTGSIVLVVDAQGRPSGFKWTVKTHRLWETDVAMGRLQH
jgi:hypothetical protein